MKKIPYFFFFIQSEWLTHPNCWDPASLLYIPLSKLKLNTLAYIISGRQLLPVATYVKPVKLLILNIASIFYKTNIAFLTGVSIRDKHEHRLYLLFPAGFHNSFTNHSSIISLMLGFFIEQIPTQKRLSEKGGVQQKVWFLRPFKILGRLITYLLVFSHSDISKYVSKGC